MSQGPLFDILVIDDGSPDGTGDLADLLKERFPDRVQVIHRQGKLGLATAYLTGFAYGLSRGYEYLIEMDADFSHNPMYLPQLISTIAERNADLVLGSRYVNGGGTVRWPWYRKLISRGGSWYAAKMLGLSVRDVTGGFKCFRRSALESLDLNSIHATGFGFQIELTYHSAEAGFHIVEIPIVFEERLNGSSKMSPSIFIEAFWMVTKIRFESAFKRHAQTRHV